MNIVACPRSRPGNFTRSHAPQAKPAKPEHAGALATVPGGAARTVTRMRQWVQTRVRTVRVRDRSCRLHHVTDRGLPLVSRLACLRA